MRIIAYILSMCALFIVYSKSSFAGVVSDQLQPLDPVYGALKDLILNESNALEKMAYRLILVITGLQFVITMYGELMKPGGDVEVIVPKLAKSVLWMGFCFWLLSDSHASNFIRNSIQYFLNHAIGFATGTGDQPFNATEIVKIGMDSIFNILETYKTIAFNGKWGGLDALINQIGSFMIYVFLMGAVYAIIMLVVLYMSIKVFMVKIEALLVAMLLPLNVAFMGLNALRDQGFAPFKHMLALVYRILILGVIVGGMSRISSTILSYTQKVVSDPNSNPHYSYIMFGIVSGFVILAYLAFKSDSLASSLASGNSGMGSNSDAGAALGGAVTAAAMPAAAAAGAAGALGGKLADLMKSGAISNASSVGTGKSPDAAPPKPAGGNASVGGGGMPPKPPGAPEGSSKSSSGGGESSSPSSSPSQASGGGGESSSPSSSPAQASGGDSSTAASQPAGNAQDAGIGGSGATGGGEKSPDPGPDKPGSGKEEKKKTLMDHAADMTKKAPGKTNDTISRESSHTSISMNVHHD